MAAGLLIFLLPLVIAAHQGHTKKGEFVGGAPVAGLSYQAGKLAGTTDAQGTFAYCPGQAITFAIGGLALGAAEGAQRLSPIDLVPGAADGTDPVVNNISVLLQSLDQDGHLNNGIQITRAIADIVGAYAINFDQTTAAFAADLEVKALLAELNTAGLFTDTDPRARTLQGATAAREQLARCLSPRRVVKTHQGALKGFAADDDTWQFLGIPYAQAPISDLRWQPPQPPARWKGVREAVAWGDQAAQNPALQRYGEGGMSEDCLYLNVTAPKKACKLPVMVWFHGGGFTALTSNTKAFNNPAGLPSQGVVQVSVNHRLGIFGYMAHPWLSDESEYGGSGNYGQMDLIAALEWVQRNIAAFGGDPRNVTIFGESGGGRKVLSLIASPRAAGLFHRAISQSGTLIPDTRSLTAAEAYGTALSDKLAITTLDELRAVPWTDLVAASTPTVVPYTNVDGWYLPDTERQSIESGQHNDVPFMIVVNTNDTPDPIGTWKNVFPWMTDDSSQNHYACLFSKVPSGWEAQGLLTYHGGELTYVHNYPESVIAHYQLGLVIDPATGKSLVIGDLNGNGVTGSAGDTADILASAGWSSEDAAVADTTLTLWSNFAKTGDPSIAGVLAWTPYTTANDIYLELGKTLELKTGLSSVFP
jgi:para-nitrobenzyl esterase